MADNDNTMILCALHMLVLSFVYIRFASEAVKRQAETVKRQAALEEQLSEILDDIWGARKSIVSDIKAFRRVHSMRAKYLLESLKRSVDLQKNEHRTCCNSSKYAAVRLLQKIHKPTACVKECTKLLEIRYVLCKQ